MTAKSPDTHHSRANPVISWFVIMWLCVVGVLGILFLFPGEFSIPSISIKPIYHGALFLGGSIIVAIPLWFASQALVKALEATSQLHMSIYEAQLASRRLDQRFEELNNQFGRLPEIETMLKTAKDLPKELLHKSNVDTPYKY